MSLLPLLSSESSAEASHSLRSVSGTEIEPYEFEMLLSSVEAQRLTDEEPKLAGILHSANFAHLCRFLVNHYEAEKRCRYFDHGLKKVWLLGGAGLL